MFKQCHYYTIFIIAILTTDNIYGKQFLREIQYRPIVLWHGMGDDCCTQTFRGTADTTRQYIYDALENVYIKSLQIGDTMKQDYHNTYFMHPDKQIDMACRQIREDINLANGYNAVGLSQGGLFLRAVAQRCPHPPMNLLITLGSPHQGIFGVPRCPAQNGLTCEFIRHVFNLAAYTKFSQKDFVPASYWHDPKHFDKYSNSSTFLADINNELELKPEYAANLRKLQKLVLIKFNNDTIIEPIASQWFEFYAPGQDKHILPLEQSDIYLKDKLGLRKLYDEGRLVFLEIENDHLEFTQNWFTQNVITYLKY